MPPKFTVRLTPRFQRDLDRLSTPIVSRVLESVRRLEANPFGPPPKIKKLKGKGIGQWRLEVWPYRARYDVFGQEVVMYRVRHRKEIYED